MGHKKKSDTNVYDILASNIKKFRITASITQEQLTEMTLYPPNILGGLNPQNVKVDLASRLFIEFPRPFE